MVDQDRTTTRSRELHDSLGHPVIDGDGHWLETIPVFLEYLREIGGARSVDAYLGYRHERWDVWYESSPAERLASRRLRSSWWTFPADTLDRATEMMPELLYERLGEFGLDFAVVYPTLGLGVNTIADPDLRQAFCRALNVMSAEMFAPFADRMTPVATIPTFTPNEAIEELEYCVNELKLKAAWLHGTVTRPVPAYGSELDGPARRYYVDTIALDSQFDYDPLWQRFVDLGVPVATHGGSMGWADRSSPNNYCFNHIGHFAQANHAFARSVFLGGVTYRFPTLNFAFLEGGCGWAVNLYHDLISHWEKRSAGAMREHLDPNNLDPARLTELFERYGGRFFAGKVDEILAGVDPYYPQLDLARLSAQEDNHALDDFAAAHVESIDDLRERFTENFYFGCEADDPMTAWANDPRMFARLKPLFSSDIGHFDVVDMQGVLEEAYELVEYGQLDLAELREFTFSNAVRLYTKMNPAFFAGTAIESAVNAELA
jgi:predicted TIM-barrel fold metal-dependent hydrolase